MPRPPPAAPPAAAPAPPAAPLSPPRRPPASQGGRTAIAPAPLLASTARRHRGEGRGPSCGAAQGRETPERPRPARRGRQHGNVPAAPPAVATAPPSAPAAAGGPPPAGM